MQTGFTKVMCPKLIVMSDKFILGRRQANTTQNLMLGDHQLPPPGELLVPRTLDNIGEKLLHSLPRYPPYSLTDRFIRSFFHNLFIPKRKREKLGPLS